jgi:hypothetical protein
MNANAPRILLRVIAEEHIRVEFLEVVRDRLDLEAGLFVRLAGHTPVGREADQHGATRCARPIHSLSIPFSQAIAPAMALGLE